MSDFNFVLMLVFVCAVITVWLLANLLFQAIAYYQRTFTSQASTNLERMFMFFDYRKMFLTNLALLVGVPAGVYFISGNLFYAVVLLIALIVMPKHVFNFLDGKRKKKIAESLPDSLAQIAGSMRSGSTFTSAIENMVNETKGPIAQEFGLMLKEQKIGISQQEALENLGDRIKLEDVDLVVTAALIARDVGGNLAEILERLSTMLRKKIEMEGKIKALTSQGKMQGWVVGMLPFGIIAALSFVEPEGIQPIFSTYLGWIFLSVIFVLEILGGIVIKKIVTIDI